MKINDLNTTQQKLLQLCNDTDIYMIIADLQVSATEQTNKDIAYGIGCYGTEFDFVVWFITLRLEEIINNDKEMFNDIVDNLLTNENKIKYIADFMSLKIVKGEKLPK